MVPWSQPYLFLTVSPVTYLGRTNRQSLTKETGRLAVLQNNESGTFESQLKMVWLSLPAGNLAQMTEYTSADQCWVNARMLEARYSRVLPSS